MTKYAVCQRCGLIKHFSECQLMRFNVICARCGNENAFGPGVYHKDFHGYTYSEAMDFAHSRRNWRPVYPDHPSVMTVRITPPLPPIA
jgi:hypothetical protein